MQWSSYSQVLENYHPELFFLMLTDSEGLYKNSHIKQSGVIVEEMLFKLTITLYQASFEGLLEEIFHRKFASAINIIHVRTTVFSSLFCILVFQACYYKIPPNCVAYTIEINFLTVLEARSPKSRCQQSWFLLRPLSHWLRDGCSLLCPHVDFSLCTCDPGISFSSYKVTSPIGLGPQPYDLVWLPPERLYLQI